MAARLKSAREVDGNREFNALAKALILAHNALEPLNKVQRARAAAAVLILLDSKPDNWVAP